MTDESREPEFVEEEDSALDQNLVQDFSQAVLYATDWTIETIISQLDRQNIEMNPRFQRRDAWGRSRKSRFIESIILGLPIPQIVLAEKRNERGRYIVLDGKQRLLSVLQFTGKSAGPHNRFPLSGLEARQDLMRKRFNHLEEDIELRDDLNAFLNHTIRTVVIRNWPNTEFLHVVFLRLNTGSVKLSPQELRQAMVPGEFSNFVDDEAVQSEELQLLLSRTSPDPRMRDVELLVRFLAMQNFLERYAGRMKSFLDYTCLELNANWAERNAEIQAQVSDFRAAITTLIEIFGANEVARKAGSYSFNRAIFDALAFYAADERIRNGMNGAQVAVRDAYVETLRAPRFAEAIESDTAGIPHTYDRLATWGNSLRDATGLEFQIPQLVDGRRISFNGFWQE